jgi:penicillin-binding protein 1C
LARDHHVVSEARKHFFLKKEAKTFARWCPPRRNMYALIAKVFWFFFSKKNAFLSCLGLLVFSIWATTVISRAHLSAPQPTPLLYDRNGTLLAQFGDTINGRTEYGFWHLDQVPDRIARATLALEDRRFAAHSGVDAWAVLRAVWTHLHGGRSGASTVAMQVARMQHPESRTLWNKSVEAGTALLLTARYGREAILAQYLRLVPYGNGSHGIGHAARWYFDKPVGDLDWAEIALLSAIPHAPAALNPLHDAGMEQARKRAGRILDALAAHGVIRAGELATARAQLAVLQIVPPSARPSAALHAILRMQRQARDAPPRDLADPRIRCTLDLGLQTDLSALAVARLRQWRNEGAQQVALMVVRRHDRQVLAALGSAGFDSLPAGRIDYTRASRSPGSTLKPFIYAMGLEDGILSPAQVMQDLPDSATGIGNFDGGYLGAILPRQALANSRNVPAATLLRQLGLQRGFAQLRELGLHDQDGAADRFGLSMAIGSLPTSLDRLMRAYTTLAEDGEDGALRWRDDETAAPPRQVIPVSVARQIALFLSDPEARLPSFPRYGATEYPFAVALKTGTSQGYRDAWVVAWSQKYVVGVWVGRADAGPMTRLSGGLSAADLAQAVLLHLHNVTRGDLTADDFVPPHDGRAVELCTESGDIATSACPTRMTEFLAAGASARAILPDENALLSIVSPAPNTRVWRNPEVPATMDRLALRARVSPKVRQIVWLVDGEPFAVADSDVPLYWPVAPGVHLFQIRLPLQGGRSRAVRVTIE